MKPGLVFLVLLLLVSAGAYTTLRSHNDARLAYDALHRQIERVRRSTRLRIEIEHEIASTRPILEKLIADLKSANELKLQWLEALRRHGDTLDKLSYRIESLDPADAGPGEQRGAGKPRHYRLDFQAGLRHEAQLLALLRDLGVSTETQVEFRRCELRRSDPEAKTGVDTLSVLRSDCSLLAKAADFDRATGVGRP